MSGLHNIHRICINRLDPNFNLNNTNYLGLNFLYNLYCFYILIVLGFSLILNASKCWAYNLNFIYFTRFRLLFHCSSSENLTYMTSLYCILSIKPVARVTTIPNSYSSLLISASCNISTILGWFTSPSSSSLLGIPFSFVMIVRYEDDYTKLSVSTSHFPSLSQHPVNI